MFDEDLVFIFLLFFRLSACLFELVFFLFEKGKSKQLSASL